MAIDRRVKTRPTPESLGDDAAFELVAKIEHRDIAGAIRPYLRGPSPIIVGYWLVNLAVLGWLVMLWRAAGLGLADGFPVASLGMFGGYLLLLPIHESLHALAYRLVGARNIRIRYRWRTLTAECVADRAVVGRRAFAFVCVLPFAVLNTALFAVSALLPPGVPAFAVAAALLMHTGAVSGDIALTNLLWKHRDAPSLWTFDDVQAGESYFFAPRHAV